MEAIFPYVWNYDAFVSIVDDIVHTFTGRTSIVELKNSIDNDSLYYTNPLVDDLEARAISYERMINSFDDENEDGKRRIRKI